MEVKAIDLCTVQGFRLTEYQIFDGNTVVSTSFNIRDDQGMVHGNNYVDVDEPLEMLLSINTNGENTLLFA